MSTSTCSDTESTDGESDEVECLDYCKDPDFDVFWNSKLAHPDTSDNTIKLGDGTKRFEFCNTMLFTKSQKDIFKGKFKEAVRFKPYNTRSVTNVNLFRWCPQKKDPIRFSEEAKQHLNANDLELSAISKPAILAAAIGERKLSDLGVKVGRIRDRDDPVWKLSNGRACGLFYTQKGCMKKGTVLSMYCGFVMTTSQNESLIYKGRCEGDGYTGIGKGPAGNHQFYVMELESDIQNDQSNVVDLTLKLVVDGAFMRNETAFMNDYHSNGLDPTQPQDPSRKENAIFLDVAVGQMHVCLVVLSKDVHENQEILVDYGDRFETVKTRRFGYVDALLFFKRACALLQVLGTSPGRARTRENEGNDGEGEGGAQARDGEERAGAEGLGQKPASAAAQPEGEGAAERESEGESRSGEDGSKGAAGGAREG